MTVPEMYLWYRLRAGRLRGIKFRRQVPIDRFVVDFLCESRRLVIEIDGDDHGLRMKADEIRTRRLEALGYRVVRYWNNDVMNNIDGVLEDLCGQLKVGVHERCE